MTEHNRFHEVVRDYPSAAEELEDVPLDAGDAFAETFYEESTRDEPGDELPRDAPDAGSMGPAYGVPGDPSTWPQGRRRDPDRDLKRVAVHPLPQTAEARGICRVIICYCDGRKVVLQ
jgi:hypothetical protein